MSEKIIRTPGTSLPPLAAAVAILLLGLLATYLLSGWICRLNWPLSRDYGPAKLALTVERLREGGALYPDFVAHPLDGGVLADYPPALWLAAILAPLFGKGALGALEAGRAMTCAPRSACAP